MVVQDSSHTPYFYLHLYVIHDLGVLIPFMPFEVDFLETVKIFPSQVTLNV